MSSDAGGPGAAAPLPQDLVDRLRLLDPAEPVLVCSDFDGTLAPIVTRPEDAAPLPGISDLLTRLAAADLTTVAVVSGRSLSRPQTAVRIGRRPADHPGRIARW